MLYFHKENTVYYNKKRQTILPTIMVTSVVNRNSFVFYEYMNEKSGMICQLYNLHMKKYFIPQQHDLILNIYINITKHLLQII